MKSNIGQGDKGFTSLFGRKIDKDDLLVQVLGNIDELNSYIGLVHAFSEYPQLNLLLEEIQEDLFILGSHLSTQSPQLTQENVKFIEENIKLFEKDLPQLKKFILPRGSKISSLLHVARAVCRRLERSIVSLSTEINVGENTIPYINRLSDLLFDLARWVNKKERKEEKEWTSR